MIRFPFSRLVGRSRDRLRATCVVAAAFLVASLMFGQARTSAQTSGQINYPLSAVTFAGKDSPSSPGFLFADLGYLRPDATGNLYAASYLDGAVFQIAPNGNVVRFAGSTSASCTVSTAGTTVTACLDPRSVAPAPDGSVYVADPSSIWRISSGVVTNVAGVSGGAGFGYVDGVGSAARFNEIKDIAVDSSGDLIVVESGNRRIRKVNPSGSVSTLAGSGANAWLDGAGILAAFQNPRSVTFDATGAMFVVDEARIRKVTASGAVSTFSGSGGYGSLDGPAATATFLALNQIAFDAATGNFFVASEDRMRVVSPTGAVATVGLGGVPYTNIQGAAVVNGVVYASQVLANSIRVLKMTTPLIPDLAISDVWGVSSSQAGERKVGASPPLASDPVNTATGSLDLTVEDLSIPGRGPGLQIVRNYDSRRTYQSYFGAGWSHTYDSLVQADSSSLDWRTDNGATLYFPGFVTPAGFLVKAATVSGGGWSITRKTGIIDRFNTAGRLVSRLDRSGQGVTMTYNGSGRLSVVTDTAARSVTIAYGTTGAATNRITSLTSSDGRTVTYGYSFVNGIQRLTSVTDPRGKTTTYTYDTGGRLTKEIDPNLSTKFTNVYDTSGRVSTQADPLGNITTFTYNDVAKTTTVTDPSGAVSIYNRAGNRSEGSTNPAGSTSSALSTSLDVVGYSDQAGGVWSATYDARGNMLTRTAPAPLSYVESWTYDLQDNPLTYVDGRGNSTTYTYNASGRLLTEVRPGGVTSSYTYNTNGTMASATDPRGGVTTYTYDTVGNVASVTSPLGNKTSYGYDTAGRVTLITSPRGNASGSTPTNFQLKFTYDANGNVLTSVDELGRTTTNVYDNAGRRTQSTAPDGGITTYTYNIANEILTTTAPDGGITTSAYDSRGLKTSETSPTGSITTYGYDPSGRLTTMVEPRGNVGGATASDFTWTYAYDGLGRLTSQTDPLGRVTTMTYDRLGHVLTTTRPDGVVTSTYDANGNVTSQATSGIGTTSAVYDGLNRLTTSTDVRGKTTVMGYDNSGNVLSITDPLNRVTAMTYDADGRQTSIVDPRGNASGADPNLFRTSYAYDPDGNRTTVTDPLGNITTTTYDQASNISSIKNARNNTTTYTYDAADRVATVTAPVGGATTYSYSTMGRLLTRTDPLSRVTAWLYDNQGRVTKKTNPLGQFFTYAYDANGNLTQIVDANANAATNPSLGTTTLTYDRLNRLASKTYSDGTAPVSYTYDTQGRRASMIDTTGTTTYGYDTGNRLTSVAKGSETFTYVNDPAGNVTSRTYPDGRTVTATYNDAGEVATVNDGTGAVTYGYDLAGNVSQMILPAGVTQNRVYDRASRLTNINNQRTGGVVSQFTYTRDANGNPTAIDVAGTGAATSDSQRNTFDALDRLTATCFTVTTCTTGNRTLWTYDNVGNRLTAKIGSAAQSVYTYNAADHLTAITGPGAATLTYNANGDQLTSGADTFTYNTARQNTASTVAGVTATFSYDGNGVRQQRVNGAVTTTEIVDVNNPLPVVVAEKQAGNQVRAYSYGPGGSLLRFVNTTPVTSGWYLTDAIGTVTEIVNPTGGTVATYRYNSFGTARGTTLVSTGYTNNPMRFAGQQIDASGNYNFRARHYNANNGRFTQTDPIDPMNGPRTSSYLYANANPGLLVDPSGLWPSWKDTKNFIVGAGRAVAAPFNALDQCIQAPIICGKATARTVVGNIEKEGVWQGLNLSLNPAIPMLNAGVQCATVYDILSKTRIESKRAAACGSALGQTAWFAGGSAKAILKLRPKVVTNTGPSASRARSLGAAAATKTGTGLARVPDFADDAAAFKHYSKHSKGVVQGPNGAVSVKAGGADMPEFGSFAEYRNAARSFMSGDGPGVLTGMRGTDVIRFDPNSGYFGVMSSNGTIRTFFRPDTGIAYFRGQFG